MADTKPRDRRAEVLAQLVPPGCSCAPDVENSIALYAMAFFIRSFERKLLEMFGQGKLSGTTHTCIGQEAHDVGVVWQLDPERDGVFANHRNHGQLLAWGADPAAVFAEIMGRPDGICGGRGGSQHMACAGFYSTGVQGGLLGAAVGTALMKQRSGSGGISVAFLGDGTVGSGMFYEALNLASIWRAPTLFVVLDNGIAQTTPKDWVLAGDIAARGRALGMSTYEVDRVDLVLAVSRAREAIRTVRESRQAGLLVCRVERLGPHSKGDDDRPPERMAALRASDPLARLRSELTRDAVAAIECRCQAAIDEFVAAAETRRTGTFHLAPYAVKLSLGQRTDNPEGILAKRTLRVAESLNLALHDMMARDERVLLIGQDLHDPYGGAFKVTRGLTTAFGDRVFRASISEAGMVGTGIGAALHDARVIVEVMFGDFILLAADQLVNQAAKIPWIYGREIALPITVRMPSGGRRGYGPTHSQSLESMLMGVPGLTVLAPSHRVDAGECLRRAVMEWPYPTVFVEYKPLYAYSQDSTGYGIVDNGEPDTVEALFPIVARRAPVERPDVTFVAYGGMVPIAEAAAEILAVEEMSVDIVVPTLLSPLPGRALGRSIRESEVILVAEEGPQAFGFGAEVVAFLVEERLISPHSKVCRAGAGRYPIPAAREFEDAVLPTAEALARKALAAYESFR